MIRKVKIVPIARRASQDSGGIFFSVLFFMSLIMFAALFLLFIYIGNKNIYEITENTRSYASTIAEGFTYLTEKNYKTGNYRKLNYIYQNKIDNRTIHEAFFVLNNGKIVCHSSKGVKNSLKGNIGNDEFAYNVDLILRQSWSRNREIFFTGYNIIKKKPPFSWEVRQGLKKTLYDEIDSPGWLVSKAVFVGKKAVGTVNFLISKDRIYDYIIMHLKASGVIFTLSFLMILFLAMSIESKVNKRYQHVADSRIVHLSKPIKKTKQKKRLHNDIVGVELLPNYQENIIIKDRGIYAYDDEGNIPGGGSRKIRDAIKVSKKR